MAEEVGQAELVVQNGVGYDGFMNNIEAASPNAERKVIVVQDVLELPMTPRTLTSGTTRRRCPPSPR